MDTYKAKRERKLQKIETDWLRNLAKATKDRTEATLEKEKALESIKLQFYCEILDKAPFQLPPFLMPKDEKNAGIINDILKKSLEIQGTTGIYSPSLVDGACFEINGFLMYYFKNIPGKNINKQL